MNRIIIKKLSNLDRRNDLYPHYTDRWGWSIINCLEDITISYNENQLGYQIPDVQINRSLL